MKIFFVIHHNQTGTHRFFEVPCQIYIDRYVTIWIRLNFWKKVSRTRPNLAMYMSACIFFSGQTIWSLFLFVVGLFFFFFHTVQFPFETVKLTPLSLVTLGHFLIWALILLKMEITKQKHSRVSHKFLAVNNMTH